jgi:hypothetical protein
MCLDRCEAMGCLSMQSAPWLLQRISTVPKSRPRSSPNLRYHNASLTACAALKYSASIVDGATVGCRRLDQLTAPQKSGRRTLWWSTSSLHPLQSLRRSAPQEAHRSPQTGSRAQASLRGSVQHPTLQPNAPLWARSCNGTTPRLPALCPLWCTHSGTAGPQLISSL